MSADYVDHVYVGHYDAELPDFFLHRNLYKKIKYVAQEIMEKFKLRSL